MVKKEKYNLEIIRGIDNKIELFISEKGTLFQQYSFLNAVGEDYICYVVIEEISKKIVGVLPLVKTSKFGLKSYHIPPFTYQFGPVFSNLKIKEKNIIIGMLLNEIRKNNQIDFKIHIDDNNVLPYKIANYSIEANQAHIFYHTEKYDVNNLDKDKRRDLRKLQLLAEKEEIKIIENSSLAIDHILDLWNKTSKRSKFNPHVDLLKKIIDSRTNYYTNIILDKNNNPLAGTFCPYDKKTMYHLVGASIRVEDKLLSRANIYSLYSAVKNANSSGLNFNFEGSNIEGISSFYRSMGAESIIVNRIQNTKSIYYRSLKGLKKIRTLS